MSETFETLKKKCKEIATDTPIFNKNYEVYAMESTPRKIKELSEVLYKLIEELQNSTMNIDSLSCKDGTHEKIYSDKVLTSFPPQRKWICLRCGAEGIEHGVSIASVNEYELTKNKFIKQESGTWLPIVTINESKIEIEPFESLEKSFTYTKKENKVQIKAEFKIAGETLFDPKKHNGDWTINGIPYVLTSEELDGFLQGPTFYEKVALYTPSLLKSSNGLSFDVNSDSWGQNRFRMIAEFEV